MCISVGANCATISKPDRTVLTAALEKYLAQRGDLCLGKYDWPIDVSAADVERGTRDALQMPVLEKLGLVASTDGSVMRKIDEVEEPVPVKRYALTEAGKKFYLDKEISTTTSGGNKVVHHGDFCAGKLSLNKVVKWDKPVLAGDRLETTVSYTYKFAAAEWAHDPEAQKVFPMVERILKGEGSLQLQQHLRLSGKSWVAVNPWQ